MFTGNAVVLIMLPIFVRCSLESNSIRCLDCNSQNNSMCIDPTMYDKETVARYIPIVRCGHGVVDTRGREFFCRKILQTILHKGYEPEVRVTRGCGWIRSDRDCYKADNEDHLETVCQCFNDQCNAASVRAISLVLVIAMALAIFWV